MQDENPYAAPSAPVNDVTDAAASGRLIDGGRPVPSGNGWQWIVRGFELFKLSPLVWILILILLFAIMWLLSKFALGQLAVNLLYPVLAGGLILGCHAQANGEPLEVAHLFAGFRDRPGQLILVGVLYMAGVLAAGLISGLIFGVSLLAASGFAGVLSAAPMTLMLFGLVLLGLMVPLAMALWFAPALVVLHRLTAVDAMKQSFRACWRNMVPFLIYGLIVLGLAIAATIPLGLGWLVLGPTLMASTYYAYRDIFLDEAQQAMR
jgi:uncharacterized membrane protein